MVFKIEKKSRSGLRGVVFMRMIIILSITVVEIVFNGFTTSFLYRIKLHLIFLLSLILLLASGSMPSIVSPEWHDKASGFFSSSGFFQ